MSPETARHVVPILGQQIRIGIFRSTTVRSHLSLDAASIATRIGVEVDGLSLEVRKGSEADENRHFRVSIPVAGMKSRFQWQFIGAIVPDGSLAILQGAFRLHRLLQTFFVCWMIASGLFIAGGLAVAVTSKQSEMWILPLAGCLVMLGGYATLFVGRAMSEAGMRRVGSQLERCLEPTSSAKRTGET